MNNPFRRWFGGARDNPAWSSVADWAASSGNRFARTRDGSGFVVEPADPVIGWRLEWGPSQRHYFRGPELRLRAELGATADLQMLVLSRELMGLLEQQVFEESTDGTETRMDNDLPEEMRWLVLYPKLPRAALGALRENFGAVANLPRAAASWIEGALSKQLESANTWLPDGAALVLVVQRGRLTLRCPLASPELAPMKGALALFGVALTAARRVCADVAQGHIGGERPSSWGPATKLPPGEETQR